MKNNKSMMYLAISNLFLVFLGVGLVVPVLPQLKEEMNFYAEQVHDIVSTTVSAFIKDDGTLANVIEEKETQIDDINKRIKKQNLKRVKKEKTSPEIGIYVNELAINYERMADHCENIAMSLVSEQENEAGGVPE